MEKIGTVSKTSAGAAKRTFSSSAILLKIWTVMVAVMSLSSNLKMGERMARWLGSVIEGNLFISWACFDSVW